MTREIWYSSAPGKRQVGILRYQFRRQNRGNTVVIQICGRPSFEISPQCDSLSNTLPFLRYLKPGLIEIYTFSISKINIVRWARFPKPISDSGAKVNLIWNHHVSDNNHKTKLYHLCLEANFLEIQTIYIYLYAANTIYSIWYYWNVKNKEKEWKI